MHTSKAEIIATTQYLITVLRVLLLSTMLCLNPPVAHSVDLPSYNVTSAQEIFSNSSFLNSTVEDSSLSLLTNATLTLTETFAAYLDGSVGNATSKLFIYPNVFLYS